MTADDHTPETNQDVFNDYVRHMLEGAGVEYIDEQPECILQIVEDGDISMEMAVNAVAIAQAAFLMTAVYTPYNEPEWVTDVWKLRGRFGRIAESIIRCLADFLKSPPNTVSEPNFMTAVFYLSLLTTSPKWQWESSDLTHLPDRSSWAERSFIAQDIDFALRRAEFYTNPTEGIDSLYRDYGERQDYYEPVLLAVYSDEYGWPTSTKWHRRYAASVIGAHLEKSETRELLDFQWGVLLDVCVWLIRELPSANLPTDHPSEEDLVGDIPSLLALTPDHSEFWAWEFGRLTATWPERIETTDVGPPDPYGGLYESYFAAFSIMDDSSAIYGHLYPSVVGATLAWNRESPEPYFHVRDVDFAPGMVNNLAHWIAKLGYRFARSMQDISTPLPQYAPVVSPAENIVPDDLDMDPSPADILIPDDLIEQARQTVQLLRQMRAIMAKENEQHLRQKLGDVWDELSDDIKRHLLRSQEALQEPDLTLLMPDPAQEMAQAVEIALGRWLIAPPGRRTPARRDRSIGNWISYLTDEGGAAGNANLADPSWHNRYNWDFADALTVALRILRDNRNPAAHTPGASPEPISLAKVVFGNSGEGSIFQLILQFANEWPPKK